MKITTPLPFMRCADPRRPKDKNWATRNGIMIGHTYAHDGVVECWQEWAELHGPTEYGELKPR